MLKKVKTKHKNVVVKYNLGESIKILRGILFFCLICHGFGTGFFISDNRTVGVKKTKFFIY